MKRRWDKENGTTTAPFDMVEMGYKHPQQTCVNSSAWRHQ
jgi:hypothetical protein